jgi:hypothetical protein
MRREEVAIADAAVLSDNAEATRWAKQMGLADMYGKIFADHYSTIRRDEMSPEQRQEWRDEQERNATDNPAMRLSDEEQRFVDWFMAAWREYTPFGRALAQSEFRRYAFLRHAIAKHNRGRKIFAPLKP